MYSAQSEHLISLMSGHHWMSAMWGEAVGGRDNTDISNIVILHQHSNICTRRDEMCQYRLHKHLHVSLSIVNDKFCDHG